MTSASGRLGPLYVLMGRLASPNAVCAALIASAVGREVLHGHDGRSGARLERVRCADGTSVIVKRTDVDADIAMRLSGDSDGRELLLFLNGTLDAVPAGVGHAVMGGWRDGSETVLVMRDLAHAMVTWDTALDRRLCRRIFTAAAAMHASFAGRDVPGACSLATRLGVLSPTGLGRADDHPLAAPVRRGWECFHDGVPGDVAEAVDAVHCDPDPLANALLGCEATLLHGDLWPVNVAVTDDEVVLLDWQLATVGPAVLDFAIFLMGASGATVPRDVLLDDISAAQGEAFDAEALSLALLAAMVDLGWNKALDAVDNPDETIRARERAELAWWVEQARRALTLGRL